MTWTAPVLHPCSTSRIRRTACGGDSGSTAPASASASLDILLTDAPLPVDSVARADLYVVRVDGKLADTDDNAADAGKGDDSTRNADPSHGWVTLASPNQSFNLLDVQSGKTVNLAQKTLSSGTYRGFRLILDTDKSSITLRNGAVLSGANGMIKFPSAGRSGISGAVHATTAAGAVVPNASIQILKSGTALADTVPANVVAPSRTDANGAYTVLFLLPASYAVRAAPPAGSSNGTAILAAVTVASGKTTSGADITLP